jgi:hypothetical protein
VRKVLEEVRGQAQVALIGEPDGGAVPQEVVLKDLHSLQDGTVTFVALLD